MEICNAIHIQPGYYGREASKVMQVASRLGYRIVGRDEPAVVIGSVDYCEERLGFRPVPDFHPEWLRDWRHREIVIAADGVEIRSSSLWFAKSADRYKAFPAYFIRPGDAIPSCRLVLSEVVRFVQEWRYYVADGCVLATGWYDGDNDMEPAPDLKIDWPQGWCGAVDFGRLDNGKIALVESHHPYACGWYGDDHAAYAMWVVEGWNWTRKGK